MADWVPANVIERLRGSHMLGVFLHIELDPPLRIWLGMNDIPAGIEGVDPTTNEIYLGGGRLLGIPDLEVLINGQAEQVEFTLSGLTPEMVAELDIDAVDLRGVVVRVGMTTLDDYYQPMSAIIPFWSGVAYGASETSPPVAGSQNYSSTVALGAEAGNMTRSRNAAILWSHPQQLAVWAEFFPTPESQAANPADQFCAGTARLARGVQPTWPRF